MSGIKPQLWHKGGEDVLLVTTSPGTDALLEHNMKRIWMKRLTYLDVCQSITKKTIKRCISVINVKTLIMYKHITPNTIYYYSHPSPVVFLHWTLPSICHRTYFHTSNGHVTWIIKKINRIPMHCRVAYESVHSLDRGHVIRVCYYSHTFSLIIYTFSIIYTVLCLTLYHNSIYCWALSIYNYFKLIPMHSIIAIHYCHKTQTFCILFKIQ